MLRSSAFLALPLGLLVTGCPSDTIPTDDDVGDTDGDTTTDDTTDDTTETDDDIGTETETTDDDTTETGGGVCGDGNLDVGEACDDGNLDEGDGCSATCEFAACALQWTWSETVVDGAPGGYATAIDPTGIVYAAGEDEAGAAWIARWDADGSLAWEQSYGAGYAADLVIGDDGDVYVVGVQTNADEDIWYARISATDGSEVWSQVEDSTLDDDIGSGITLDPEGSVVVVGRVRVGDGDDDVWVSKRSADDGTETWVSMWSGMGDGTFSTDRGASVVATDDGAIWVGAREHVDFDTQEATLIKFDAAGTELDSWQPQAGGDHQHESFQLATDGTNVYYLIVKFGFPFRSWMYKFDGAGTELWSKVETDWLDPTKEHGEDFQIDGLDVDADGNLLVMGEFFNEDPREGIEWGEAWVAQLDGEGEFICRGAHMVDDGDIIPPSLDVYSGGGSAGGFALTGQVLDTPDNSLWTGFFRL
jgi:cysteine-rich repeat protein